MRLIPRQTKAVPKIKIANQNRSAPLLSWKSVGLKSHCYARGDVLVRLLVRLQHQKSLVFTEFGTLVRLFTPLGGVLGGDTLNPLIFLATLTLFVSGMFFFPFQFLCPVFQRISGYCRQPLTACASLL